MERYHWVVGTERSMYSEKADIQTSAEIERMRLNFKFDKEGRESIEKGPSETANDNHCQLTNDKR